MHQQHLRRPDLGIMRIIHHTCGLRRCGLRRRALRRDIGGAFWALHQVDGVPVPHAAVRQAVAVLQGAPAEQQPLPLPQHAGDLDEAVFQLQDRQLDSGMATDVEAMLEENTTFQNAGLQGIYSTEASARRERAPARVRMAEASSL